MKAGGPPTQSPEQQQIVQEFHRKRQEVSALVRKISELEEERNEHRLVVTACEKLEPERRCFRLVGGVLVERTVGEVLPAVRSNLEGLEELLGGLRKALEEKENALVEFKVQNKIRIVNRDGQEVDDYGQERQEDEAAPKKKKDEGTGVLV